MEKIVEKTLLFDFYGELLTKHQQEIYESVVFNDMSLSEAAEEYGISRQGVHDLIRRCERSLQEYEDKLHMIERFEKIRKKLTAFREQADEKTRAFIDEITEDLES